MLSCSEEITPKNTPNLFSRFVLSNHHVKSRSEQTFWPFMSQNNNDNNGYYLRWRYRIKHKNTQHYFLEQFLGNFQQTLAIRKMNNILAIYSLFKSFLPLHVGLVLDTSQFLLMNQQIKQMLLTSHKWSNNQPPKKKEIGVTIFGRRNSFWFSFVAVNGKEHRNILLEANK